MGKGTRLPRRIPSIWLLEYAEPKAANFEKFSSDPNLRTGGTSRTQWPGSWVYATFPEPTSLIFGNFYASRYRSRTPKLHDSSHIWWRLITATQLAVGHNLESQYLGNGQLPTKHPHVAPEWKLRDEEVHRVAHREWIAFVALHKSCFGSSH
jgi:hypothetical protein